MRRNYLFKIMCMSVILMLATSCGNKSKQGKGLFDSVKDMVDPHAGAVDMGFKGEDGKPLYWAKGNLIAKADGTVEIAASPEYIPVARSYSEGVEEWDLFGWADITGKKISTDALGYPSPKEISGNPEYDIATKLGGKWRTPTFNELRRLFHFENTFHEWTTINGVPGMRVTSKINGNSIFLPAAGTRRGNKAQYVGKYGWYLSSTIDPEYGFAVCGLEVYVDGFRLSDHWFREEGRTIRPVTE